MKPTKEYNGRSRIRMFNMDNRDFMNQVDDNYYDLAICDPPYGIGEANEKQMATRHHSQKKYKGGEWDLIKPTPEQIELVSRKSKNQIMWGANHYIDNFPFNVDSPCWVFWDKDRYGDFADGELAWTSFKTAVRKIEYTWDGFRKKHPQERIHCTEKPIGLYKWLLRNYAELNQKIFDGWGGSMSIAIACWDLGFDLDIIELDPDYFNDAVKRFENHISQTQLF